MQEMIRITRIYIYTNNTPNYKVKIYATLLAQVYDLVAPLVLETLSLYPSK